MQKENHILITRTIQLFKNNSTTLTTYILDGKKKRGVVLICPGGGYQHVSPREGEPIALKFAQAGYHAFVLNYSVAPVRFPQQLLDGIRAIDIIIENSEEWCMDVDKITFCGFSAGGHLATILTLYHTNPNHFQGLPIPKIKPKGLILSYPVITSTKYAHQNSFINLLGDAYSNEKDLFSMEKHVNESFPQTFIWHTFEDKSVPIENTLLFVQALREKNIPFELHTYPKGNHGLALATKETAVREEQIIPHVAKWIGICIDWLNEIMEEENDF